MNLIRITVYPVAGTNNRLVNQIISNFFSPWLYIRYFIRLSNCNNHYPSVPKNQNSNILMVSGNKSVEVFCSVSFPVDFIVMDFTQSDKYPINFIMES